MAKAEHNFPVHIDRHPGWRYHPRRSSCLGLRQCEQAGFQRAAPGWLALNGIEQVLWDAAKRRPPRLHLAEYRLILLYHKQHSGKRQREGQVGHSLVLEV